MRSLYNVFTASDHVCHELSDANILEFGVIWKTAHTIHEIITLYVFTYNKAHRLKIKLKVNYMSIDASQK